MGVGRRSGARRPLSPVCITVLWTREAPRAEGSVFLSCLCKSFCGRSGLCAPFAQVHTRTRVHVCPGSQARCIHPPRAAVPAALPAPAPCPPTAGTATGNRCLVPPALSYPDPLAEEHGTSLKPGRCAVGAGARARVPWGWGRAQGRGMGTVGAGAVCCGRRGRHRGLGDSVPWARGRAPWVQG